MSTATAATTRASATAASTRANTTSSDGNSAPQAEPDGNNAPRSVYFDWSGGPVHALHDDTPPDQIVVYAGLNALLDALTGPTRIRAEAPFESFNVERRMDFLRRCDEAGHDFKVISPRATARRRRALGFEEKTNEIDVQVIRNLANDGTTHFTPVKLPDARRGALREDANAELMLMRRTLHPRVSTRSKTGWMFDSEKDHFAETIIAKLPAPADLTHAQDIALCTGPEEKRAYSKCAVAAVGVVAAHARNTREFDFLAGLYQNGYPSQVRSDLMHHRWWKSVEGKLSFSDYRRELRWLFHQIKNLTAGPTRVECDDGNNVPQAATTEPQDGGGKESPARTPSTAMITRVPGVPSDADATVAEEMIA